MLDNKYCIGTKEIQQLLFANGYSWYTKDNSFSQELKDICPGNTFFTLFFNPAFPKKISIDKDFIVKDICEEITFEELRDYFGSTVEKYFRSSFIKDLIKKTEELEDEMDEQHLWESEMIGLYGEDYFED